MDIPQSDDGALLTFRDWAIVHGWSFPKSHIVFDPSRHSPQDPADGPQFATDLEKGFKDWLPPSIVDVVLGMPPVFNEKFLKLYMKQSCNFCKRFHNPMRLSLMASKESGWYELYTIVAKDQKMGDELNRLYFEMREEFPEGKLGNRDWFAN